MFIAINRLLCATANTEFVERASAYAGRMDNVRGFVAFEVLKRVSTPASDNGACVEYLAISRWESQAAYETWVRSESFAGVAEAAASSPISARIEYFHDL